MSDVRKDKYLKGLGIRAEMEDGKLRSQCYNCWVGKVRNTAKQFHARHLQVCWDGTCV